MAFAILSTCEAADVGGQAWAGVVGDVRELYERIERIERGLHLREKLDADARADVRQRVAVAVVLDRALARVDSPDREDAYLRRMLQNACVDVLRQRRRLAAEDEGAAAAKVEPSWNVNDPELRDARTRRQLAAVRRHATAAAEAAVARRSERYREAARRTWRQIEELAFGSIAFEEILERDEGIGSGAARDARARAENRMYKAHSRFRQEMEAAVRSAELDGTSPPAEARLRLRCLSFLCRNGPRSAGNLEE
jgi:hypothetical protein